jgi:hypothetical protein
MAASHGNAFAARFSGKYASLRRAAAAEWD